MKKTKSNDCQHLINKAKAEGAQKRNLLDAIKKSNEFNDNSTISILSLPNDTLKGKFIVNGLTANYVIVDGYINYFISKTTKSGKIPVRAK
jgi:hypothetical protein